MVTAFASVPGTRVHRRCHTKQQSQTRRLRKNLTATLLSACSATSIFRMVSSASCCDLRPERRSMKNLSPNQMNLYCFIYRMGPNGAFYVRSCWLYPLPLFCLQQIHKIIITLCGCQSVSICKCVNAFSATYRFESKGWVRFCSPAPNKSHALRCGACSFHAVRCFLPSSDSL